MIVVPLVFASLWSAVPVSATFAVGARRFEIVCLLPGAFVNFGSQRSGLANTIQPANELTRRFPRNCRKIIKSSRNTVTDATKPRRPTRLMQVVKTIVPRNFFASSVGDLKVVVNKETRRQRYRH